MITVQRWLSACIVALLLVSIVPFSAAAAPDTPDPEDTAPLGEPTELIVRINPDASLPSRLAWLDEPVSERLARSLSGNVEEVRTLAGSDGLEVFAFVDAESAARALETLQQDPAVDFVEPNYLRELHWAPDGEEYWDNQSWWLEAVNLPDAWNNTTGDQSIVVAVIDSGVSPTHPDLAGKLVPGHNAIDGSDNSADIHGHGTRVAGIIAAAHNDVGIVGTAMDVKIMPVRVLGNDGRILVTWIHDAIVWAVDHGADVINLSFGNETPSETELAAVRYATERGVTILASAGNRFNRISYPAGYPEVIAVGSVDAAGNRSRFSSIITEVDVAAPGELLYTPSWDEQRGDHWDDHLFNGRVVEGTSFSAAIVSGIVALQKSINPDLTPEQVRSILRDTAVDSGDPGLEAGVGAGLVDAEAAVRTVSYWSMYNTWYPTDYPVANGQVVRTWLWGTDPPGAWAYEEYTEARHGYRLVYYYDKSRMEITDPLSDRGERWYVTNGLLVNELISGNMQIGDGDFIGREPAAVNVAGDLDDTVGPTYATFGGVLDAPAVDEGHIIIETISRDGTTGSNPALADYGVWGSHYEPITGHRVANVFWDYLNSYGPVLYGDDLIEDALFDPWFYATGLPVTEAYWSRVTVAGVELDVLMQCFERRCLTYTPANEANWQVEMGNVGLHYYTWRYNTTPQPQPEEPDEVEVLYQSSMTDWPEATFAGGSTFTEDGAYRMLTTGSDGFTAYQVAPVADLADVTVSVDVMVVDGGDESEACLVARFDITLESGYRWCIDETGETFAMFVSEDDEEELIAAALHDATFTDEGEWNELSISLDGETLIFSINGEVVDTVDHDGAAEGKVGISVTNHGDESAEYAFRDMLVTSLPAE